MNIPERIKYLRKKKGFSVNEVATKMGLNLPSYYDLENSQDEWDFVLTIREFRNLARILDVSPLHLAGDNGKEIEMESFKDLSNRIQSWIDDGNRKESLSWEVDQLLLDPKLAEDNPIIFLKDLGKDIGFDWRSFLGVDTPQQKYRANPHTSGPLI
ncbi:helix-turn-helix transcriptional regulator [Kiritimatiellota bacterium B12222]|nr:helix-turn-helix transcriptional regulator [Kiritimatiellota bacterium B12222]